MRVRWFALALAARKRRFNTHAACCPICGESRFSVECVKPLAACRCPYAMFRISRDTPAYFLTSVTHNRLPIFQTDKVKAVVASAFDEARRSGGFKIFAYSIMPDHTHTLTENSREIKEVLRYLNGISARRVVNYLKENGYQRSLDKLSVTEQRDTQKYSVYQHHPNAIRITGEDAFMQKVNYIHLNPVKDGLVSHPDEYLFSSARLWHNQAMENEPLLTDHREIDWR